MAGMSLVWRARSLSVVGKVFSVAGKVFSVAGRSLVWRACL